MLHTIRTYINQNRLLRTEAPVIVGLSGGADSVALLHVLKALHYTCIAAHCNFHLRGDESDRDAIFARQKANELHIPYYIKDFDTQGYASRQHISIEMAARELRYALFEELRKQHEAQAIAVAHHRDDNVETVLLNLIRGAGIRGLSGMRPERDYIVRPFLETSRQEILDWLNSQNITFCTDSSNLSDAYARNSIRLHLLPKMETLNPAVKTSIARTAVLLSDVETIYNDFIEKERNRLMDSQQRIQISALLQSIAPQTVLYELLKPFGFTRFLAESIFNALSGKPGKIFFTPDSGYQLVKDRDYLLISTKQSKDLKIYTIGSNDSVCHPVRLQTQTSVKNADFKIDKSPLAAAFDFDKLTFPLRLRTWRKGDWFIPYGMKGRKKLSDYFSDHKFDHNRKQQTWLLCSESDVIWVVGERIDDRYKIRKTTKKICTVHFFM